jgi:hypothetical protein
MLDLLIQRNHDHFTVLEMGLQFLHPSIQKTKYPQWYHIQVGTLCVIEGSERILNMLYLAITFSGTSNINRPPVID